MKKIYCFIVVFLLLCLGILTFVQNNQNANESKIDIPQLIKNESVNLEILDDTEQYIIKNFGFRNEILSTYTFIQEKVFKTSAVENVIVGEDGFLYLGDTVEDYLETRVVSEREVFQIQKTLMLMSEYVESKNGKFIFVVAPNKNSLYDKMPYNYIKTDGELLRDKVFAGLDAKSYVNLFETFLSEDEILYYKTDSHWNEQGARLAYDTIMNHLDKEYDDFTGYTVKEKNIKGDLYQMLYPKKDTNEKSYPYQKDREYIFLTKTRSTEEGYIVSENENKEDSLLMFRDSFANNLVSFFSDSFQYAVYDKNIYYDLFQMDEYETNYVIVEIAERNLNSIQSKMPLFMAPEREVSLQGIEKNILLEFKQEKEEDYICIQGKVEEDYLEQDSLILLENEGVIYELTPQLIDGKYGFCGCIPAEMNNAKIWISGSENYWIGI